MPKVSRQDYMYITLYRHKHDLILNVWVRLFAEMSLYIPAWKFLKLVEVSLSPSPRNPYAPGHVIILRNG